MLMVINPSIEIYLLDLDGNILAYSAPQDKVKRDRVDLQPVRKWLEGNVTIPLLGDDPRNPRRKKVFSVAPVLEQGKLEGYLYVILGGEMYDNVVQKLRGSYILQLTAGIITAGLLFALITGLILFAVLTRRLKRLALSMDAFRDGHSAKLIDVPGRSRERIADDIDRLGSTFKVMAGRIEEQMEDLRRSDTLRRELIANVSHDLRTPLATLQGYIETLLIKESHLSQEERRRYLKIAIKHCQRLSKLVRELLELAKLESFEFVVRREDFNVSELLQDVIQKFQLTAVKKHIRIFTKIQKKLPFVNADIGLIERVLENLIENAIRYTPRDGSIRLTVALEGGNVSVQVSDTGRGIPDNELPHIFNRFYQSEKHDGKAAPHSGLGLAITKKILELHNSSIEVTSLPSSGTTFTFQLPAAVSV